MGTQKIQKYFYYSMFLVESYQICGPCVRRKVSKQLGGAAVSSPMIYTAAAVFFGLNDSVLGTGFN